MFTQNRQAARQAEDEEKVGADWTSFGTADQSYHQLLVQAGQKLAG